MSGFADPSVNPSTVFAAWLDNKKGFHEAAVEDAFAGRLRMGGGRGLFWRYFLGIITPPGDDTDNTDTSASDDDPTYNHFVKQIETARKAFTEWEGVKKAQTAAHTAAQQQQQAKKRTKGPRFGDDDTDSDSDDDKGAAAASGGDNPLSASESSTWGKYFAKLKVMELVDKDLNRLWSGEEFFENLSVRAQMREVLEALIDTNIVTDYCQGMHEVLSLVMLVLSVDSEAAAELDRKSPNYELLRVACSVKYLKHDAFSIIVRILSSRHGGMGLAQWYEADPDRDDDRPVVKLSAHIQGKMLAPADPELSKHLCDTLDVQPAAYGLRWLRLLFLREFPFSQSATLWDAIFANHLLTKVPGLGDPSTSLCPAIAVAMLIYTRQDLLQDDYSLVLKRLMRFPPVETVSVLIQRAAIIAHGAGSKIALLCGAARSLFDSTPADVEDGSFVVLADQSSSAGTQSSRPRAATLSPNFDPPSLVDSAPVTSVLRNSHASNAATRGPSKREEDVGNALAKVIDSMGAKWFPATNGVPGADDDVEYIMAIAELKRLRDVLLHGLPLDQ